MKASRGKNAGWIKARKRALKRQKPLIKTLF